MRDGGGCMYAARSLAPRISRALARSRFALRSVSPFGPDPRLDLAEPVDRAVVGLRGGLDLGVDRRHLCLDPRHLGAQFSDRGRAKTARAPAQRVAISRSAQATRRCVRGEFGAELPFGRMPEVGRPSRAGQGTRIQYLSN